MSTMLQYGPSNRSSRQVTLSEAEAAGTASRARLRIAASLLRPAMPDMTILRLSSDVWVRLHGVGRIAAARVSVLMEPGSVMEPGVVIAMFAAETASPASRCRSR
jgi:hypothetical protein